MQRRRETKAATAAKIFEVTSDGSDSFPLALKCVEYLMAYMTKSEADTLTRKVKARRLFQSENTNEMKWRVV